MRCRLPGWVSVRPRMLLRGVVHNVRNDVALINIPSHHIKAAILHVSQVCDACVGEGQGHVSHVCDTCVGVGAGSCITGV